MRSRPLGLPLRVIGASVLCSGLVLVVFALLLSDTLLTQFVRGSFALNPPPHEAAVAECQERPSTWRRRTGSMELFAYELETGRSLNPDAPPLDETLRGRLGEESLVARIYFPFHGDGERGGGVLHRVAEAGPCSLLYGRWYTDTARRGGVGRRLAAALIGFLGLTAALTTLLAVWPLLARLTRLAEASAQVGTAAFASPDPEATDALGRIAGALTEANQRILADEAELRRAKEALADHLANVAHDLRTPIASLQLTLSAMAQEPSSDGDHGNLADAMNDAAYLAGLITNLNLAARLKDGLDPREGDPVTELGELVDRVTARWETLAHQKGMEVFGVRPDDPVEVICHPVMLEQVLSNLLGNAVKAGEAGGHAAVVLEQDGEGFELVVVDDGPGVPPEQLPRISERTFRSGDPRQRDPSGGGLGLAIVAEVCARVGWSLALEQNAPSGLKVVIRGARGVTPQ